MTDLLTEFENKGKKISASDKAIIWLLVWYIILWTIDFWLKRQGSSIDIIIEKSIHILA